MQLAVCLSLVLFARSSLVYVSGQAQNGTNSTDVTNSTGIPINATSEQTTNSSANGNVTPGQNVSAITVGGNGTSTPENVQNGTGNATTPDSVQNGTGNATTPDSVQNGTGNVTKPDSVQNGTGNATKPQAGWQYNTTHDYQVGNASATHYPAGNATLAQSSSSSASPTNETTPGLITQTVKPPDSKFNWYVVMLGGIGAVLIIIITAIIMFLCLRTKDPYPEQPPIVVDTPAPAPAGPPPGQMAAQPAPMIIYVRPPPPAPLQPQPAQQGHKSKKRGRSHADSGSSDEAGSPRKAETPSDEGSGSE